MSAKERNRLKVLARVKTGGIRLIEAAEILGMSYRQSKRLNRRCVEEDDPGAFTVARVAWESWLR